MEVRLYKPQNSLLNEFVECFYTLKRAAGESSVIYAAFPSVYAMICLNANASVEFFENNLTIAHCPNNIVETSLIIDFDYPGLNKYEGATDEIVVYFKPLGLNAFLEHDLRHYVRANFVHFAPFNDYEAAMTKIFSLKDDPDRIQALEEYWLSKLKGFRHPFLPAVVDEMMSDGASISITALVQRHGISRMTLNKHFDRHLCATPSQFRKVVRFRKALEQYRNKFRAKNLAAVSNGAEYFDQSHMIKDFKALTRLSPKAFFSKISELEEGQIIWLFL